MKLFSKYNRINISATILIFLVGSMAFYFVLQYVLIRQLDDTLWSEKQEVVDYVNSHHQLPEIQNTKNQWIEVVKINALLPNAFIQTVPLKKINEQEYIRQLIFSVKANNQYYQFTVNKSEAETEDLLQLIILVTMAMIGLMLLFNYLINRKLVTNTWKPFYTTIDRIKDYAAHLQPLALSKEPIDEINLLNESINSMTERISKDYLALRSFTENASHEMQTPLAIIRSKVESLLQDAEGNEKTIQQLLAIEDASLRLSKLHQSLLLLTKLENRQFVLNEPVLLDAILKNKITERQELIDSKLIICNSNIESVIISFHQHLAEILVSNLLNNAIRYTPTGGNIQIELSKSNLIISNTAIGGALNTSQIFQRFYKEHSDNTSTGLGLAIVYEVCLAAGFVIEYKYQQQQHFFTINLSK